MKKKIDDHFGLVMLIGALLAIILLVVGTGIRFYNCARVDEIIAIKNEIRAFVNPDVIDQQINDLERRDYFGAVKYDIVEVRCRNERNKELLKLYQK